MVAPCTDRKEAGRSTAAWRGRPGVRGVAALEFALVAPVLIVLAFAVVDFGRLFHARLVVTNVAREGGNLAARSSLTASALLDLLQSSSRPIDLQNEGRIYIVRVRAGTSAQNRFPTVVTPVTQRGSLGVQSSVRTGLTNLGLDTPIYNYLTFNPSNAVAAISDVVVVEVFHLFRPLTPLPSFVAPFLLRDGNGVVISSRAVFQVNV